MSNLTTTPPTDYRWFRVSDTETDWMFWYGCMSHESHLLPVGALSGVVYSPNRYAPGVGWRYVVFQVDMRDVLAGTKRATGKLSRVYVEKARRALTVDEIAHFEGLIAEIVLERTA